MDPNIVLVVADSLRRDRVGCYGCKRDLSSTIDKLADEGRKFDYAFSTGSWTVPAHGSLFTGMYPSEHGIHALNKYFTADPEDTLAGQLSELGYETVGFSSNPWVTTEFRFANGFDKFYDIKPPLLFEDAGDPRSPLKHPDYESYLREKVEIAQRLFSGSLIKQSINGLHQRLSNTHPIPTAEKVRSRVTQWDADRESSEPFFLFFNFMDTHEPYRVHEEYIDSNELNLSTSPEIKWNQDSLELGTLDQSTSDWLDAVYDASVEYLDSQLDELFSWLKESGMMDDTIVLFMSDHGQSLGENNFWGHGTFLYDELIRVPLIVSTDESHLNSWPDASTTVSIGELPFYLFDSIGESFVPNSSTLYDTATEKLQGNDAPVMTESHGPPEGNDDLPPEVSADGYRSVRLNEYQLLRNLDEDTVDVRVTGSQKDSLDEMSRQLEQFEANLLSGLDTVELNQNMLGVRADTRQRLEDLGYL